ncbi:hypothetical protein Mapa_016163 [Marchantia paleacea]|nr:hypothetical protein Mapa_016163 [Marchantia paleacea]
MAVSPPPITARGLFLNIGAAPSHTAQAEIPLFQNPPSSSPAPLKSSLLATAPVAIITVSASTSFVSVNNLNGLIDKSTRSTVSVKILVPNRRLCARNLSHNSPPKIPSGNPGKFSTSVVVVNCPPAAIPFAIHPSKRIG